MEQSKNKIRGVYAEELSEGSLVNADRYLFFVAATMAGAEASGQASAFITIVMGHAALCRRIHSRGNSNSGGGEFPLDRCALNSRRDKNGDE